MENMKWYSPSQVSTAKHVSYPQLTATLKGTKKLTYGKYFMGDVDDTNKLAFTYLTGHSGRAQVFGRDHKLGAPYWVAGT